MTRSVHKLSVPAGPAGRHRIVRRLAAIMGADISAYSALMGRAEEDTHHRVGAQISRVFREIKKSHGRVISFAGDGVMAEFPSAVEALKCALRIQTDTVKRNARLPEDQRILFRIGINSGEIILELDRTGGNAVNIAARLQAIAEPGGIALSEAVYQQVCDVIPVSCTFLGERSLKNIRALVAVHMISAAECSAWAGMPALPRHTPGLGIQSVAPEYRASLAILPFRMLQKDQSNAYFAEGIIEDVILALGALKDLLVIARSSTQTYAGGPIDLRRVGHELDVRYVLHGSVRHAGNSLRIVVELSEAQTGTIIWVDRFDGEVADVFDLQDCIARRVAASIAPHLRERELTRSLRKHPNSMTAFDLTLQALDLFHHADRASLERSGALLEQAITADPGYAPAYSNMAAVRMRLIGQGWSADKMADSKLAAEHARAAIEREPNDAAALSIYGHIQSYLLKHFSIATKYLERALDVGPSCPLAWGYSSLTSGYLGMHDKAVPQAEQAVRLAPIGLDAARFQHYLSQAYYLTDRYEDAVAWGRMSAALAPANVSNLMCLTASLVALGDLDAARRRAQEIVQLVPTFRLSTFRARTPLSAEVANRVADRLNLAGLQD
jgi:adenylate cyclase